MLFSSLFESARRKGDTLFCCPDVARVSLKKMRIQLGASGSRL
jgi:hypothetical protein